MSALYLTIAILLSLFVSNVVATNRAFYIFGDSLVDSGNNNYLASIARADRYPYGIDSGGFPTGRFSNGKNLADFLCESIGVEPLLPYLNPELAGQKLLVGANFASAGCGILNDTGTQFIEVIRLFQQLELFQQYQERLARVVGASQAQHRVNRGLYLVSLGGNDFVNNYYYTAFPGIRRLQYPNVVDFIHLLISELRNILSSLHKLGARKVVVFATGQLGCVPDQLAVQGVLDGKCSALLQRPGIIFNKQLAQMLRRLNRDIGSDVFITADADAMFGDLIKHPRAYGYEIANVACCGQGAYNGVGLCTATSYLCPNRDVYVYWDPFHPTERACKFIVQQLMMGSLKYITPMNVSTLMAMDSWT